MASRTGKLSAASIGLLGGLTLGLFTKNQRIAVAGDASLHTTSFMVWTILAFVLAMVFTVGAAVWRSLICLGFAAAFMGVGLVWGLA